MIRKFYVITVTYEDVLDRVVGWTENQFIAKLYYANMSEVVGKDPQIIEYKTESVIELSQELFKNHSLMVEDFVDMQLITKTSKDNKLCMITISKYNDITNNDVLIKAVVESPLMKLFLLGAPLTKYIKFMSDEIMMVLFTAHKYMVKATMSQNDITITDMIDPVYFWYYVYKVRPTNYINTIQVGLDIRFDDIIFVKNG